MLEDKPCMGIWFHNIIAWYHAFMQSEVVTVWLSKPLYHSIACLSDLMYAYTCMHVHFQKAKSGARAGCLHSSLGKSLCTCKASQVHLLNIFPVAAEHESLWRRRAILHQPKGYFIHLGYMHADSSCMPRYTYIPCMILSMLKTSHPWHTVLQPLPSEVLVQQALAWLFHQIYCMIGQA